MRCWLNPAASVLAAAIKLALLYPSRVVNHTPWRDSARAAGIGHFSPKKRASGAINAAKARAGRIAKRQQELAL